MNKEQGFIYSAYQFAIFRIVMGLYLVVHFLHLLPFSSEIWSNQGMLPDSSVNFTYGAFPNILNTFDSPFQIQVFILILIGLSMMVLLGVKRRIVCLLLWYGWACLFHRNNLISNPGLPMMGWLFLAMTLIPEGEPFSLLKKQSQTRWEMPKILFYGAWVIVGLSYTISGIDKFMAPSWRDGTAIQHLLHNPLARDSILRDFLITLPEWTVYAQTWLALGLEISFGILCCFKRVRPWALISIVMMHLGILMIVDFADLTLGVLMLHLFTFDSRWFSRPAKVEEKQIVFYDGVCGLCNRYIQFLMDIDTNKALTFSPLQDETAKEHLPSELTEQLNSIVYLEGDRFYTRSDAILKILNQTGGLWKGFALFRLIPRVFRDTLYEWISEKRYAFFGKTESCRLPTAEEVKRFV